jgi:hypothetical protein
VLKFPPVKAVLGWYRSDGNTDTRKVREGAPRAGVYVVDGVV